MYLYKIIRDGRDHCSSLRLNRHWMQLSELRCNRISNSTSGWPIFAVGILILGLPFHSPRTVNSFPLILLPLLFLLRLPFSSLSVVLGILVWFSFCLFVFCFLFLLSLARSLALAFYCHGVKCYRKLHTRRSHMTNESRRKVCVNQEWIFGEATSFCVNAVYSSDSKQTTKNFCHSSNWQLALLLWTCRVPSFAYSAARCSHCFFFSVENSRHSANKIRSEKCYQ